MFNDLLSIIEAGHNIHIKSVPKRTENKDGVRGWYVRFVWEVDGQIKQECDWEGFETAKECVNNLIINLGGR